MMPRPTPLRPRWKGKVCTAIAIVVTVKMALAQSNTAPVKSGLDAIPDNLPIHARQIVPVQTPHPLFATAPTSQTVSNEPVSLSDQYRQDRGHRQPVRKRASTGADSTRAATTPPKPASLQLGIFADAIAAETYWASFKVRYDDLARTYQKQISPGGHGIGGQLHRLHLGGFANLDDAEQKCRQLKADGTDCSVIQP
ncbi:MAG: SPOR domain-containing protein [Pseudomonadota bacterium]